jgi:hypothetical protein
MARAARRIADRPEDARRSEASWRRAAVTMTDLGGDGSSDPQMEHGARRGACEKHHADPPEGVSVPGASG